MYKKREILLLTRGQAAVPTAVSSGYVSLPALPFGTSATRRHTQ